MQPVELSILRVPEEILLYLQWIVEYGAAFVQYDLPVIQDKMPLSLVDIDDSAFTEIPQENVSI